VTANDPPWIRDAARAVGREIAGYFATVRAFTRAPASFAVAWSSGEMRALNPLAFVLNALAVLGPWRALWARLFDPNPKSTPIWFDLLKPAAPIAVNVMVTSLFHVFVRVLGTQRPMRSSLAVALYVSGGPLAVLNFLLGPIVLYGFVHRLSRAVALWSALANFALLVVFLVYLVAAQAALHRMARWRITIAVLVAWIALGVGSTWVSLHHPEFVRGMLGG